LINNAPPLSQIKFDDSRKDLIRKDFHYRFDFIFLIVWFFYFVCLLIYLLPYSPDR